MKKCMAMLLVLTSLLVLYMPATAKPREFGYVTNLDVNLRASPSTEAASLDKLPVGDEVEIRDTVKGEDGQTWYIVIYNGKTGYIRNDLVFVRTLSDRIAYCLKDDVNLRGGPGQSAYVITKLQAGKPIRVQQMVGEWYYVSYEGKQGFVQKDLLQLSKQYGTGFEQLLTFGMSGLEVKRLQQELQRRNFIEEKAIDGNYGETTRKAVKEFQSMAKLEPSDGVAGPATIKLLYDPDSLIKKPAKVPKTADDFMGRVQMIDWWKGGSTLIRRFGGTARLYDVSSKTSFAFRRVGGNKHMDVVPLTAKDTAIFKNIVGHWSWERRSILVIVGSRVYAGSMNCQPHGSDKQKNDNFPGVFCIHFTNSRTHGGNSVDSAHQAAIRYAFNKFKAK